MDYDKADIQALRLKRQEVHYEAYRSQLEWQMSNNVGVVLYCDFCYWGSSSQRYAFCPHGHGDMKPIGKYLDEILGGI